MRIAAGVCYDGSPFEGWQSQPSGNTVQDRLESAFSAVADAPVRVVAAGRTDAGVHAIAQVVHFDCAVWRADNAWVRGANALLPGEIAVQWARPVDDGFHARFSAEARSYCYVLYNHPVRHGLLSRHVGWYHRPLDAQAMRAAAALLVGEQDFSAFRSSECQAKAPVRRMMSTAVRTRGPYLFLEFTANAFLHHMVRNIVGCLVYVGSGRHPPEWMAELIAGRDRRAAAPTFSPAGLYLAEVRYPAGCMLPDFAPLLPLELVPGAGALKIAAGVGDR
ncbi:MAG: tRNA pseudouridine(38-40) synthase TruA [Betaproteobacteria bacterium]|nr:tRNA pseudouridine(38-40) synthase TruA [Betaproteobacteria bacterium]